ncbi:hypothetical protein Pfo_031650 [Paulownia fortunei]|nr:hypothetical protein Pfo_031650 [Paulownia fortunei]
MGHLIRIILSKNEFERLRPNLKAYGKYVPQGLKLAFVGNETTNWTIYADTLVPLEEKATEKPAQNQSCLKRLMQRKNGKQVQLTASSTDTATDKVTTDDATKTATVSSTVEKSTVPTTVGSSVTQDQAKDAVDKAQDTTTDVTINDDNASSKTDEVLSDLNKQDQAVKDATAKQQANDSSL